MIDPTISAIITAIMTGLPPTLVALAALRQGKKTEEKAAAVDTKTNELLTKTTEIHTQTNSSLSNVLAALDVANAKIEGLQKLTNFLTDAKNASDRVAVAIATPAVLGPTPPTPGE